MEPPSSTRSLIRPREYAFQRLRVSVLQGPDKGLERDSAGSELGIGVAPGNDVVLSDATVSRHHCLIRETADGFLLRDLGSKNGTYVAGCRVESARFSNAASVTIGESTLRLQVLPERVSETLGDAERFGPILGASIAMRRIFSVLSKVATSDATILLEGDTGTGKGLIAETLHRSSRRATRPFVVVDCSAIPPTLIEAELFGHAKGAFTGAHSGRAGAFEAAAGGTVFLDEIGELPIEVQPKLLRVLEERTVKRLGTTEPVRLDIRVLAATNRDLRKAVNEGRFRPDLYYRLNVVRVRIPSLRERREDIPVLAAHFYERFAKGPVRQAPAELLTAFAEREWPGNVRELRSAIERALLMEELDSWAQLCGFEDEALTASELLAESELSFREAKERAIARWERDYVEKLVASTNGNVSAAARRARMDRNHLRELLVKHGASGVRS